MIYGGGGGECITSNYLSQKSAKMLVTKVTFCPLFLQSSKFLAGNFAGFYKIKKMYGGGGGECITSNARRLTGHWLEWSQYHEKVAH